VYQDEGKLDMALPLLQRALAIRRERLGASHVSVAESLNNLAALVRLQENYAEAESLQKQANAIWEQSSVKGDLGYASGLNNLGELYSVTGRFAEAEPLYRQAIAIWESVAPDHLNLATCLSNLALLFGSQGKNVGAEKLLLRALAIRENALGKENPSVLSLERTLAKLYRSQRRDTEAAKLEQHSFR
jgi:tetratricopeptide (TPR) repeat protein